MCSNTTEVAIEAGASSIIFWCLRCTEQSRPKSEMALPYWSARICTSRCRDCLASLITKIGEPGTSAWTYSRDNTNTLIIFCKHLSHNHLNWFFKQGTSIMFPLGHLRLRIHFVHLYTITVPFPFLSAFLSNSQAKEGLCPSTLLSYAAHALHYLDLFSISSEVWAFDNCTGHVDGVKSCQHTEQRKHELIIQSS